VVIAHTGIKNMAEKNEIKKELSTSTRRTPNKKNSTKGKLMAIVPLERSPKMIQAMQKAKIDLGLTPRQAFQIIQPTDLQFIRNRIVAKTKTGKEIRANYVPGRFFELKLISVFGWNWRFEILKTEKITREDKKREITKTGRLWFKLPNGEWNFVDRSGGAVSKEGVDDFNREKAAETDAFKRCCLALGFFNDVYAPVLGAEDRAIAESMETNHIEEGEYGEPVTPIPKARKVSLKEEDLNYFHPAPSPKQLAMVKIIFEKLRWKVEKPIEKLTRKEAASIIERGIKAAKQKGIRLVEQEELPTIQVEEMPTKEEIPVVEDEPKDVS